MEQKIILEQILNDRKNGDSYGKLVKKYGIPKSTIIVICNRQKNDYYVQQSELKKQEKENFVRIIKETVPECNSFTQVCKILGKKPTNTNLEKIRKIITDNEISIAHFKNIQGLRQNTFLENDIFCKDSKYSTSKLKNKLIKLGYKEHKCELCKNTEWNGKPIPLETHHINGDHYDNRLENLQLLCPNCHAQTDSYCGKNKIKKNKKQTNKKKTVKQHIDFKKVFESFIKTGSLYKTSLDLHISFKNIKKQLQEYGIPSDAKGFRKYILDNYGDYKKQLFTEKNFKGFKEYTEKSKKPVDCYTKDGIFVKHYEYINQVKKDGFNSSHISSCCKGKLKSSQGYIWKYSEKNI